MEISNPDELDATQTQIIKDHLALVFDKKTPDRNDKTFDAINEGLEKIGNKKSRFGGGSRGVVMC